MTCHQNQCIIREPGDFRESHRKLIKVMVKNAIAKNLIHRRNDNWAETVINAGHARAVLLDDKLVGFFVIKHFSDKDCGDIVYGESCLWKTRSTEITTLVHDTLLEEAKQIGLKIYGGYYRNNAVAKKFYSPDKGWKEIDISQYPVSLMEIVNNYLDVLTLKYHPLNQ